MAKVTLTLLATFATIGQAIKLTNSDWDVVAGEAFTIKWTAAEGPVSIRLKSGPSNNLQSVQEIASSHPGESFTWTVPTTLDDTQYAIEVEDDSGNINYSGQFSVSGHDDSQTGTGSAGEHTTTTNAAVISSSALADVSSAPTSTLETEVSSSTSKAHDNVSASEMPMDSADSTKHETRTVSTLTTTRTNEPSATESDATESGIPNSGNAGLGRSSLIGAVVGVLLLVN
ncbi:Ser-Thr-rich glycosyl-phosphatidyl-inositol-anchored membrane family-domain-containing protein [Triangularia verruculosa]|uniref:Ser-Thr-rich glycosyl-phosphatidyl-inositol-anchored membrane family-domain-containing protein n=1 Tax=Triangularia verruculosa TaxID=2587418 RepID=A0AAN6XIE2_9PEZI|nr:Ser-Thr-rich glycosyl-phosphatidyl-inositol-anchored membrane family-domain-containing protein [Triangularia verruculosa]